MLLSASLRSCRPTPMLACLRVGNKNLVITSASSRRVCPTGPRPQRLTSGLATLTVSREKNVPFQDRTPRLSRTLVEQSLFPQFSLQEADRQRRLAREVGGRIIRLASISWSIATCGQIDDLTRERRRPPCVVLCHRSRVDGALGVHPCHRAARVHDRAQSALRARWRTSSRYSG